MEQSCIYLVTPVACQAFVDRYISDTTPCFGIDAGVLTIKDKKGYIGSMGDFDSLKNQHQLDGIANIVYLNCEKDDTDTKAAIEYVTKLGYSKITVLGGFMGKRIDHAIANYILAFSYPNVEWIDEYSDIVCVNDRIELCQADYDYFSLFTIDDCVVTIENAKYNLNRYALKANDALCVSNTWIDYKDARISVEKGTLLVMRTKEK